MLSFTPVDSGLVKFVQYDEFCKLMTVEVSTPDKNGAKQPNVSMYQYSGISRYRYDSFKRSKSKGTYFATNIRSKYPTRRVTMPIVGCGPTDVPVVLMTNKK